MTIKKLSKKSVKEDSLEARLEELRTMHKESKAKVSGHSSARYPLLH